MKKVLAGIIVFLCLLQLAIPGIARQMMSTKLQSAASSETIEVDVNTVPAFMMLLGRMDYLRAEANNGVLGRLRVSNMVLEGRKIQADIMELDANNGKAVSSAESLTLTGIITEENLQQFLEEEWGDVENLKVTMTPEQIAVSGQLEFLGKKADLQMSGIIFEDNGEISFHMEKLEVKNSRLGNAVIGNFFGDIVLLDTRRLYFPAEYESAVMQNGSVILKARMRQPNE